MKKFHFKGIVKYFNQIILYDYEADTFAISKKKALNNLTYRCKNEMGYYPTAKIILEGDLSEV